MNPRTITHNAQLSELTNAMKPAPTKPTPLISTWEELHQRAIITAETANERRWIDEPPNDCIFAVAIVLAIGIIAVFKLIKE